MYQQLLLNRPTEYAGLMRPILTFNDRLYGLYLFYRLVSSYMPKEHYFYHFQLFFVSYRDHLF